MENIAVFYGGKSVEHEVSVITALQILENIDKTKYNAFPIYIDYEGVWWRLKKHFNKSSYQNLKKEKKERVFIRLGKKSLFFGSFLQKEVKVDAIINCCHGTQGEDGCLQGVFEILNIPYSGAGVMASAVCMNKIVMKQLFEKHNFLTAKWTYIKRNSSFDLNEVSRQLKFPLFVKPSNLGSSIGISKCKNLEELKAATKVAFEFDDCALIEEAVENLIEINCSVQKIDNKIVTSELETPINWEEFLTYEDKYVSKSKNNNKTKIGPKLNKSLKNKIEKWSVEAYEKFFLDGVIRIDYLYNKQTKELFINEINTIPGSLSFYLWKPKGLSFSSHITNLILQAQKRNEIKQKNITKIDSPLLNV